MELTMALALTPEDVLKLILAIVVGGLIGAEREFRDKAAGFRTLIFITLGATLFTMFSIKLGGEGDPVRIAANIVTGIGFLGAGAIMRGERGVTGLTTAATIWLSAALGLGIGGSAWGLVVAATPAIMVVLIVFPYLERIIDRSRTARTYEVTCPANPQLYTELVELFKNARLQLTDHKHQKVRDLVVCSWHTYGRPANHTALVERLIAHPGVIELRY